MTEENAGCERAGDHHRLGWSKFAAQIVRNLEPTAALDHIILRGFFNAVARIIITIFAGFSDKIRLFLW